MVFIYFCSVDNADRIALAVVVVNVGVVVVAHLARDPHTKESAKSLRVSPPCPPHYTHFMLHVLLHAPHSAKRSGAAKVR